MVECNVLDLVVDVNSETRTVTFTCYTDAPCGTFLIASAERRYKNHADDDCVWILFNDRLTVEPSDTGDLNSVSVTFSVDDGDSRALSSFNDSLGPYSKGMASPLSDTISISVILGGRQRLKAFGRNNCNLSGAMVAAGTPKTAKEIANVSIPIDSQFTPFTDA